MATPRTDINPLTDYVYPRQPELEAAPPDDGGHQGSYTRPQDMLIEPESTGQGVGAPMLQYTNDFPHARARSSMTGLVFIVAAVVIGLILAFWVNW